MARRIGARRVRVSSIVAKAMPDYFGSCSRITGRILARTCCSSAWRPNGVVPGEAQSLVPPVEVAVLDAGEAEDDHGPGSSAVLLGGEVVCVPCPIGPGPAIPPGGRGSAMIVHPTLDLDPLPLSRIPETDRCV